MHQGGGVALHMCSLFPLLQDALVFVSLTSRLQGTCSLGWVLSQAAEPDEQPEKRAMLAAGRASHKMLLLLHLADCPSSGAGACGRFRAGDRNLCAAAPRAGQEGPGGGGQVQQLECC